MRRNITAHQRLLRDRAAAAIFLVSVAPHELPGGLGVDPRLNALVFEEQGSGRVYSCPIDSAEHLLDFTNSELRILLRRARQRDVLADSRGSGSRGRP